MYYNELFFFYNQGEKSDDPISPAYIPTLFSFTSSKRERELQHSLRRYNAAKHREKAEEQNIQVQMQPRTHQVMKILMWTDHLLLLEHKQTYLTM